MGDKRVYTFKTPHNLYPMGYEYIKIAWNDNPEHKDDQFESRQSVEHAVKRAEFAFVRALSPNPTDHQRRLTRIVGLKEGMPESFNQFSRGEF